MATYLSLCDCIFEQNGNCSAKILLIFKRNHGFTRAHSAPNFDRKWMTSMHEAWRLSRNILNNVYLGIRRLVVVDDVFLCSFSLHWGPRGHLLDFDFFFLAVSVMILSSLPRGSRRNCDRAPFAIFESDFSEGGEESARGIIWGAISNFVCDFFPSLSGLSSYWAHAFNVSRRLKLSEILRKYSFFFYSPFQFN